MKRNNIARVVTQIRPQVVEDKRQKLLARAERKELSNG